MGSHCPTLVGGGEVGSGILMELLGHLQYLLKTFQTKVKRKFFKTIGYKTKTNLKNGKIRQFERENRPNTDQNEEVTTQNKDILQIKTPSFVMHSQNSKINSNVPFPVKDIRIRKQNQKQNQESKKTHEIIFTDLKNDIEKQCDSEDSGKGDSELSDFSGSSQLYLSKNYPKEEPKKENQQVNNYIYKQKSVGTLDILKIAQQNIKQKISENSDEIYNLLVYLSNCIKYAEIVKIQSYVADLEKITYLLYSLARRLAVAEVKLQVTKWTSASQQEKDEWRRKQKQLSNQLEEAKDIKEKIDTKFQVISNFLEEHTSWEIKIIFANLMEEKIKLLITIKEVEDKIKIEHKKLLNYWI